MAVCQGCGAHSMRTRSVYDERMTLLREECVECSPKSFEYHDPSDGKVWTGIAAHPEQYKQYTIDGETKYFASDETRQDLINTWSTDDDDRAMERKRRIRRTEPMTPGQIKETEHWAMTQLRPWLEKAKANAKYKHVDYDS